MWEFWMHPDYDPLHVPLTSKLGKFQPQTNIFPGNSNPFSIKSTVVGVKIFEKSINISDLKSHYHRLARKVRNLFYHEKNASKHWKT